MDKELKTTSYNIQYRILEQRNLVGEDLVGESQLIFTDSEGRFHNPNGPAVYTPVVTYYDIHGKFQKYEV